MDVLDKFDEIRVEHKGAFEDTDDNDFNLTLFLFDLGVVVIDLACKSSDSLLDSLLIIE